MRDPKNEKGDVFLAGNKFTPLKNLFKQEMNYKDGRTATRIVYPTQKQWLYVKYLFAGVPQRKAFIKAGYTPRKMTSELDFAVLEVHNNKTVQILINAIIGNYLKRCKVSAQGLVDEALKVYDRCDTVHEQLATLKFINTLLPKGYASRCNLSNCPLRRQKK